MDLETFLISLFVLIDDWVSDVRPREPKRRPGRQTLLSDGEVLTLAILCQWQRFRSERDFWRFVDAHLRGYFPDLLSKASSTGAFVRVRACRMGLFAGQASFGRSVSKTEWVYGFKVALSVTPEGVVTSFGLAPANCDERPIGEFLVSSDGHDAFLADKGFSSVEWERRWLEEYGALVAATPQESARRAWPEKARRWAAGKRQLIEGVIWQLKDQFSLERHRAKTLGGLLAHLAAKVAAYTCGQVLNRGLGRPLRHLAALLI